MSITQGIKKKIVSVISEELGEDAAQLVIFFETIATSTTSEGHATEIRTLGIEQKRCNLTRLLDVSGFTVTGSEGKAQFRLTTFICHPGNLLFFPPINVVATPISATPHFLTLAHSIVDNGADVEIAVASWGANGTTASNVFFDWPCRVEVREQIV